jgi:pantoate--beta-alanine ligase
MIFTKEKYCPRLDFDGLENQMEGKFRPGHFDGVGTIKTSFEIVTLQMLIWRKDFQQLQIVKKMVSKSKLKVNVMRHLQRINGLAMSLEMSD